MKHILYVKKAPYVMLYGELGQFPISVTIKKQVISFWSKLLLSKESKLPHRLYSVLYYNFVNYHYDFQWLQNVKSILDEIGISNIWLYQHPQNSSWLSKTVLLQLQDQYKQSWTTPINELPKCLNYIIFKTEHKFKKLFELNVTQNANSLNRLSPL